MPLPEAPLFPRLEPPAGGLARLRSRLSGIETRRSSRLRWAIAAAVPIVVATLTATWIQRARSHPRPEEVFAAEARPVLMRLGVLKPAADPVTAAASSQQTLLRVPLDGDKILFYWTR